MTELTITTYENGLHAMLEHVGSLNMNERDFLKMNNILKKAFDKKDDIPQERSEVDLVLRFYGTKHVCVDITHLIHTTPNNDEVVFTMTIGDSDDIEGEKHHRLFYSMMARMCIMNQTKTIEIDECEISLDDLENEYDKNSLMFEQEKPANLEELLRKVLNLHHRV